jgi:hypothetical protein
MSGTESLQGLIHADRHKPDCLRFRSLEARPTEPMVVTREGLIHIHAEAWGSEEERGVHVGGCVICIFFESNLPKRVLQDVGGFLTPHQHLAPNPWMPL